MCLTKVDEGKVLWGIRRRRTHWDRLKYGRLSLCRVASFVAYMQTWWLLEYDTLIGCSQPECFTGYAVKLDQKS